MECQICHQQVERYGDMCRIDFWHNGLQATFSCCERCYNNVYDHVTRSLAPAVWHEEDSNYGGSVK